MKLYCDKISNQIEFETQYFRELNLLDESFQICQTKPLCIVWNISIALSGFFLKFKLGYKLDISIFSTIYGRPSNSSRQ